MESGALSAFAMQPLYVWLRRRTPNRPDGLK